MSDLYPKIPALWARESERPFAVREGVFREPELEFLQEVPWVFTEKIDGTNIRVSWDGHAVSLGGRTDNAQIPAPLVNLLGDLFGGEAAEQRFEEKFGETPATLYGEGFGGKIQSGGKYSLTLRFAMFDVRVGGWWLRRADALDVAEFFAVESAPLVFTATLNDAAKVVRDGIASAYGDFVAEGVVGKPEVDLFNRKGERIIVKIKTADFQ